MAQPLVPYVVLVGNVGAGKSTLVEKVARVHGLSSAAQLSFTNKSTLFHSFDRRLIINDTPGANPLANKLGHNQHIAAAFNYQPVSKVFIVVRAETRIDTTVHNVRHYAEQFIDLDPKILGVIVTHMDQVTWNYNTFTPAIAGELGMDDVVYSDARTDGQTLQNNILRFCGTPLDITVDGEEFFRLFKISNNNLRIIRSVKTQVDLFRAIKRQFDQERTFVDSKDHPDLLFEFQAYMTDNITKAQQRLSNENNFTFLGDGAANELGHVADMTNQLRDVLYDIRIETLQMATNDHGVNDLRKCPHCGQIWALIVGCTGATTCGSLVNESDSRRKGVMATFIFDAITTAKDVLQSFRISKSGERKQATSSGSRHPIGCGKSITWAEMKQVAIPPQFRETVPVSTHDIPVGPTSSRMVTRRVGREIEAIGRNMQFGN